MTPLNIQLLKCTQCFISVAYRTYILQNNRSMEPVQQNPLPTSISVRGEHHCTRLRGHLAATNLPASPATRPLRPVANKPSGNKLLL